MLLFVFRQKIAVIKPFSDRIVNVLLAANIVFCFIPVFLPFEETVGLEKSPVFEYFSTRILKNYYLPLDSEPEKAEYPGIAAEKEDFPKVDFDFSATKGKNVIVVVVESTAFERTPLGGDKEAISCF